ncbi:MAG: sulfatase [Planctomycetota bacterium]|jgi:iduronate 2-sulfatase|nr:sulfatase [Planctomycetota bacterium]
MPRNVLLITVDDLRPQLGCFGSRSVQSPHIDALAANGVTFQRAYCQQAVCAPSRASVFSGCRPATTGVFDLQTPLRSTMPDVLTLPQHFKQSGFTAISVGKNYHHRIEDDPDGWSREPSIVHGDWQGRGYLTDEALEAMRENGAAMAARGDKRKGLGPAFECADVDDDAYHDGQEALAAIATLQELSAQEAPFFLAVGFHKPHLPFNAPKRYWDLYDPANLPLAPTDCPPVDSPAWAVTDFGEMRGYFGIPKQGPVPEPLARQLIHGYHACVSYMDAQVGRVMAELDRLGLRDDTVVLLWGDHGWKLGEHGSWCKHSNMEIDCNAPLLVSTPERAGRGAHCERLVEFVDIYPSLCELAGITIPEHCEGTSMAPLLEDPERSWKSAAFSCYPREGHKLMGHAMKTDDCRFVEWRSTDDDSVVAQELYDHREHRLETHNRAGAEKQRCEAMAAKLHGGWRAVATELSAAEP